MISRILENETLHEIKGGLVVSCVGDPEEPLLSGEFLTLLAVAARAGGAVGIRACGPEEIALIRARVNLPMIGYYSAGIPGYNVSITPTVAHAEMVAAAGADLIEIDATQTPHPERMLTEDLVHQVKLRTGKSVVADISTAIEGILAQNMGADVVMTTLAGLYPVFRHDGRTRFRIDRYSGKTTADPAPGQGTVQYSLAGAARH